jgi:gamma-glutamyltranspeptidase
MLTVNETTPVFKNMHLENIYCNGAAKAIFVRGLPEMPVENIVLKNMLLQAKQGIDIQEAANCSFQNIQLEIADKSQPLIDIINAKNTVFNQIKTNSSGTTFFRISGNRNNAIQVTNTNANNFINKSVFELGATANSFTWK